MVLLILVELGVELLVLPDLVRLAFHRSCANSILAQNCQIRNPRHFPVQSSCQTLTRSLRYAQTP